MATKEIILKQTQTEFKGHLTRQINKCNDLSQQSPVDHVKLETYFQVALSKFEQVKHQIEKYLTELVNTNFTTEELDDIMVGLIQFEDDTQARLDPFIKIIAQNKATFTVSSNPRQVEARLPPINLPAFSGKDKEDWDEFWNKYVDLVDSKPSLPKSSKFSYLQVQLSGEAKSVVPHLRLTTDSYGLAVTLLKDNYADPKVRTSSHLVHEMFHLPSLEATADSLQVFKL
ncbi:uncharacterized protein [Procambarus clarkii]|uniref:uncharacterized protein n=1 Tax=Procambarus clarkii TaxID=6728 RepID=UPI00374318C4